MNDERLKALFAVLTAVFIVWFIVVSGWMHVDAQTGGGTIINQGPTVPVFSDNGTDPGNWDNSTARTEYFNGTVKDTNGEIDIAFVNFTSSGVGDLTSYSNNTAVVEYTSMPSTGVGIDADGITVWNDTTGDGILNFSVRRTFAQYITSGTYTQWLNVTDDSVATGSASETTSIGAYSHVTWQVVFINNTNDTSGIWAFSNETHSIVPTSTNVHSTNWLRAYNDGLAAATLTITFGNFTNTTGGTYGIINLTQDNNMQFRYNSTTDSMNDTVNTAFGSAVSGSISGASAGGSLAVGAYRYFEYLIIDVSPTNILYAGTYSGTVSVSYV